MKLPAPEIVIFPPGTPVIIPSHDIENRITTHTGVPEKFVRRIYYNNSGLKELTLEAFLALADRELEFVAEMCGSLVVGHRWGLIEVDPKDCFKDQMLPENHCLVAEVDRIVRKKELLVPEKRFIGNETRKYALERFSKGKPYLSDMHELQFMRGNLVKQHGEEPSSIYLVDIDPRFKAKC